MFFKVQGSKLKFKIEGLKQIPENAEITCATLCHRHKDFYLKVTCFLPKKIIEYKEDNVGIDFGCITTLTLSNHQKKNLKIKENLRLRRTSRRLKKQNKGSRNYIKQKDVVNKEYHKLTNRKKDKKNKIVHNIANTFKIVIVQDESIKAWHAGKHRKAVQHSMMGGIMRDLEKKSHTFIKVDKFFPSSQLCYCCGHKQKMKEEQRKYVCPVCGYKEDRDINAALNIQREGLRMLESGEAAKSDKCKVPKEINSKKILTGYKKSTKKPVEREPLRAGLLDSMKSSFIESGSPIYKG